MERVRDRLFVIHSSSLPGQLSRSKGSYRYDI